MSGDLLRQWGENIRTFRRVKDRRDGIPPEKGMQRMAEHLEVTVATVSRWETGKAAPTDDHKVEIAEYLEVDVRSLFPLVRAAS